MVGPVVLFVRPSAARRSSWTCCGSGLLEAALVLVVDFSVALVVASALGLVVLPLDASFASALPFDSADLGWSVFAAMLCGGGSST